MLLSTTFDSLRTRSAEIRYGGTFIRSEENANQETTPQNTGFKYDIDLMLSALGDDLIAVFRYSEATEALRTASMSARRVLEESGFTFVAFDSGIPSGYFLNREAEDRVLLRATLLKQLEEMRDEALEWGTFDLDAFLLSLEVAQPLKDTSLIDYPLGVRTAARRKKRASQKASIARRLAYLGLSCGLGLLAYVFALTFL